jgi:hypothetical protein
MPVKVFSPDRGSRIHFEQTLRTLCNMQVSMSLPNAICTLRNDFVEKLRAKHTGYIITARLNIEEQCFLPLEKRMVNINGANAQKN